MLLKKGSIIMSESSERPVSVVIGEENVMSYDIGSLVFNSSAQLPLRMVTKDKAYSDSMGFVKVHLYLFIEEVVEEHDLILNEGYHVDDFLIEYCKKSFPFTNEFNKLIATTDNSLNMAQLPVDFIDKFVEDNSITDVLVIHEELREGIITPIIDEDNVISLSNKMNNYSSVEVVGLFTEFFKVHNLVLNDEELIWISKNI